MPSVQRQNLDNLRNELHDLENLLRERQQQALEASQAVARHERETKNLRLAFQISEDVVGKLQDALEEDRIEEGRLEALKDHLKEAEEDLITQQGSYEEGVVSGDKAKESLNSARQRLSAIDTRISEATIVVKKAEERALKCSKQRQKNLLEKNASINAVNDAKDLLAVEERRQQELNVIVKDHTAQAEQVSARVVVPPGETTDSLDAKLEKLNKDYSRGVAR